MGQLGLSFALALFLQEGKHLTALQNGLWVLPYGLSILVGAPIAGRLTSRIGTVPVIRLGLVMQTVGLIYIAFSVSPTLTFAHLLPGPGRLRPGRRVLGHPAHQRRSCRDIPPDKSGVASGTNTTVRQVGSALGIAVIGTVVTTQTINHAVSAIASTPDACAPRCEPAAAVQVRALGANYRPPARPVAPRRAPPSAASCRDVGVDRHRTTPCCSPPRSCSSAAACPGSSQLDGRASRRAGRIRRPGHSRSWPRSWPPS